MAHAYRIREIAQQSGLSEATVDRVLNGRAGVRAGTADEVHRAIADLERQRTQLRLSGRTFVIDVVMQTPGRFSTAVRAAFEAEMPLMQPAVFRARFHFRQTGTARDVAAVLGKVAARGSDGVILTAPDRPEIIDAVALLGDRGIPVMTLVTDVPASKRLAYIGIDNRAAGATAAYLMQQWLGERPGDVLVTISRSTFHGEGDRDLGFRAALRMAQPGRTIVDITDSEGLDDVMADRASRTLAAHPDVVAVYSAGGGNRAIIRAFQDLGRSCAVFIAHDLDGDNRVLVREGHLSAVLHHDLRLDARNACQAILRAHGAVGGPLVPPLSPIQVVTPYNVPSF